MYKLFSLSQHEYNIILNRLFVVFAFTFPIKHYATSTITFLILIIFLIRRNYLENLKKMFTNKVAMAFLLFLIIELISLTNNWMTREGKEILIGLKYSSFLFVFISFIEKEYVLKVIYALLLGILVSEFVSYMIYFSLIPHEFYFYNEIVWEASPEDPSPFLNHILYGNILSLSVGLLLFNIIKTQKWTYKKIVSLIFFMTITINMFLQASRTGYILYFAVIIFTIIYIYRLKAIKFLLPVVIIFSIVITILYNNFSTFHSRVSMTAVNITKVIETEDYHSSIGYRLGIYKYSLKLIENNFLFGVGSGNVMNSLKKSFSDKDSYLIYLKHPHNEYLYAFMKSGVFGFFALLYLFYTIFSFKQKNNFLNFSLKLGTFILFIAMFQDIYFQGWRILFFVILITVGTITLREEEIEINYSKREIYFYITVFLFAYISAFAKTFKYIFN